MCGRYLRRPDETALAGLGVKVPEPFLNKHSVRAPNYHAGTKWQNRVSARAPVRSIVAKLSP